MCGGTPGGTMAVGILGPGPWPDKGATLGGMACQPPSCLPCPPEGDTWGGMLMVIMSTASLSTPFMSTLPGGPGGGLCPLLLRTLRQSPQRPRSVQAGQASTVQVLLKEPRTVRAVSCVLGYLMPGHPSMPSLMTQ